MGDLWTNFLTVGTQVLILFVLVAVGYLLGKIKVLNDGAVSAMTTIALYVSTPCVIVKSFIREFDPSMMTGLLQVLIAGITTYVGSIALAHLVVRGRDDNSIRVLRLGVVLSNAGFMALPLQQALLQDEGVFYGAVYVAVFNLGLWSYGLIMMGGRENLSAKKLALNPGLIGLLIGLIIFVFSLPMPSLVTTSLDYLGSLNTPLPMLIIGYYLSQTKVLQALKNPYLYWAMLLRLIVIPAAALGLMWLCGLRGTVLVACTIATSAPVAVGCSMFAAKFGRNVSLSAELVALSTVASVVTMPLVVALSQTRA